MKTQQQLAEAYILLRERKLEIEAQMKDLIEHMEVGTLEVAGKRVLVTSPCVTYRLNTKMLSKFVTANVLAMCKTISHRGKSVRVEAIKPKKAAKNVL